MARVGCAAPQLASLTVIPRPALPSRAPGCQQTHPADRAWLGSRLGSGPLQPPLPSAPPSPAPDPSQGLRDLHLCPSAPPPLRPYLAEGRRPRSRGLGLGRLPPWRGGELKPDFQPARSADVSEDSETAHKPEEGG